MALDQKTLIMSTVFPDKYGGAISQKVWPTHTVFIDWFNSNASNVWGAGLEDLYEQVNYDGIWIDMNEATGFC